MSLFDGWTFGSLIPSLRGRLRRHPTAPLWLGWGAQASGSDRCAEVLGMVKERDLRAIGVTRSGQPRHPLYAPADALLEPWPWRDLGCVGHPVHTFHQRPPAPPCLATPGATPFICT